VKTPAVKKTKALKTQKDREVKQMESEMKTTIKVEEVQDGPKRRIVKGATPD